MKPAERFGVAQSYQRIEQWVEGGEKAWPDDALTKLYSGPAVLCRYVELDTCDPERATSRLEVQNTTAARSRRPSCCP